MKEERSVELTLNSTELAFPMVCPKCLSPKPTERYEVEHEKEIGRMGKIITVGKYSLEIPICGSCKQETFGVRNGLRWSAIGTAILLVLITVAYLALGTQHDLASPWYAGIGIMAFFLVISLIGYFVLSPVLPVEIVSVSLPTCTILFRREQYESAFAQSNSANLVKEEQRVVKIRALGAMIGLGVALLSAALGISGLILPDPMSKLMGAYVLLGAVMIVFGIFIVYSGRPWLGRRVILAVAALFFPMVIFGVPLIAIIIASLILDIKRSGITPHAN